MLSQFFKKPVLLRCTHCHHEYTISSKEVCLLEKRRDQYDLCPVNELCHSCNCITIPVNYSDSTGKSFTFKDIKQKIDQLPLDDKFFADPDDFDA